MWIVVYHEYLFRDVTFLYVSSAPVVKSVTKLTHPSSVRSTEESNGEVIEEEDVAEGWPEFLTRTTEGPIILTQPAIHF